MNSLSRIPPSLAEHPRRGNPLSYWASTNSRSEPKKGWVQKVQEGELVSGLYFLESSGAVVEAAHRYGLKQSQTFGQLYFELLKTLDKRYRHEQTEDAAVIRAELAGEYVLKLPVPKPEPMETKIPDVLSVPSDAEILERGRMQLSNQLSVQDPNLSPDERRYLDGPA